MKYHHPGYSHRKQSGDNKKMQKFSNRIYELRKAEDWSLAKLEDITGISAQQLNRLEKGERRLNEDNIRVLANAFQIRPEEIFSDPFAKDERDVVEKFRQLEEGQKRMFIHMLDSLTETKK